MANEISDAVKAAESALPDNLTWLDAFRSHKDATLELWQISGKVGVSDLMNKADRIRLADKIVKHQATGDIPIPKQTEAGDAMSLVDNADREYILAAASHRRQLQQSDTESIFDIAARLKKAVETKRAAAEPPDDTDRFAGNRPGWRNGDEWAHDKRKKQQTTHVRSDEPDTSEEALSDARTVAYQDALTYTQNAWRIPGRVADAKRKKQYYNAAGQEEGSSVEEEEEK